MYYAQPGYFDTIVTTFKLITRFQYNVLGAASVMMTLAGHGEKTTRPQAELARGEGVGTRIVQGNL